MMENKIENDKTRKQNGNTAFLSANEYDFEIPESVDVSKLTPEELEDLFPSYSDLERLVYVNPFELDNLEPDIPVSDQITVIDDDYYTDEPGEDDTDIWSQIEDEQTQEKMTISFQTAMEACKSQDVSSVLMLFLELIRLNFILDCYINFAMQIVENGNIPLSTCKYLNAKTIDVLEKLGNATIVVDDSMLYITPVLDGLKEKAYNLQAAITAYCLKYHNYSFI